MDRIDLNVPFAEKNKAKAAGAKWDSLHRTWYWPGSVIPGSLSDYAIPGLRPDREIMGEVAERMQAIIADLDAAYERKMAIIDIMSLIRADKIAQVKYAPMVLPILHEVGKHPVIAKGIECLIDTIYGEHYTLPESGIAGLDEFIMMALPKQLRPSEALDRINRLDSGHVVVAGMKVVFAEELKKRNL